MTIARAHSFDAAALVMNRQGLSGRAHSLQPQELVLVLNMANAHNPGGGVEQGDAAQEEDLFRTSNYEEVLPKNLYPLGEDDAVLSPVVWVLKNGRYERLREPFPVACLALAADRDPALLPDRRGYSRSQYARPEDWFRMRNKVRGIFRVARRAGYRHLVLGALGCGAFHHPSWVVASLFQEAIEDYGYAFDSICFAILVRNDRDEQNWEAFSQTLHAVELR